MYSSCSTWDASVTGELDCLPVPLVPKPVQLFKLQGTVSSLNKLLRWKAAKAFAVLFSFQINCAKS